MGPVNPQEKTWDPLKIRTDKPMSSGIQFYRPGCAWRSTWG